MFSDASLALCVPCTSKTHNTNASLLCLSVRVGGHHWGTSNGDIVGRGLFRSSIGPLRTAGSVVSPLRTAGSVVSPMFTVGSVVSPCVQPDPWCRGPCPPSSLCSAAADFSRLAGCVLLPIVTGAQDVWGGNGVGWGASRNFLWHMYSLSMLTAM